MQDYTSIILQTEGSSDCDSWLRALQGAAQTFCIDSLCLEKGSSEQFDDEQGKVVEYFSHIILVNMTLNCGVRDLKPAALK